MTIILARPRQRAGNALSGVFASKIRRDKTPATASCCQYSPQQAVGYPFKIRAGRVGLPDSTGNGRRTRRSETQRQTGTTKIFIDVYDNNDYLEMYR